jgi:hypothetical protein
VHHLVDKKLHDDVGAKHHDVGDKIMKENFVLWVIFAPITFMEVCVFWFCKVEAEYRQIYQ